MQAVQFKSYHPFCPLQSPVAPTVAQHQSRLTLCIGADALSVISSCCKPRWRANPVIKRTINRAHHGGDAALCYQSISMRNVQVIAALSRHRTECSLSSALSSLCSVMTSFLPHPFRQPSTKPADSCPASFGASRQRQMVTMSAPLL